MKTSKVNHGLANPELSQGTPPVLQFRYTFNVPFVAMTEAFIKKYNWEAPTHLTTIEKIEQLDDDRILIYRRHDVYNAPYTTWE